MATWNVAISILAPLCQTEHSREHWKVVTLDGLVEVEVQIDQSVEIEQEGDLHLLDHKRGEDGGGGDHPKFCDGIQSLSRVLRRFDARQQATADAKPAEYLDGVLEDLDIIVEGVATLEAVDIVAAHGGIDDL